MLPELALKKKEKIVLKGEYSSGSVLMNLEETKKMLEKYNLLYDQIEKRSGEILE